MQFDILYDIANRMNNWKIQNILLLDVVRLISILDSNVTVLYYSGQKIYYSILVNNSLYLDLYISLYI